MKQNDLNVGGEYQAKVSGNLVTVKLLEVFEIGSKKRFRVRNLKTNRVIDFRSAARLRPLPKALQFFLDCHTKNLTWNLFAIGRTIDVKDADTLELNRSEAISLVHDTLGVGTWLVSLRQARTADGLVIPGVGTLRVR